MQRTATVLALAVAPLALLFACGASNGRPSSSASPTAAPATGLQVTPVPGLRGDFIKGADVSMLKQIELSGGKFSDDSGVQKDGLLILKEHGVNWIRLRLWNNPVFAADLVESGVVKARAGDPVGGGNCDEAKTVEIARRAKALGLKILLDFHYSDFWADPGKQNKPAAWANLTATQLGQAVYDFTARVVGDMKAAGATPDMVQIGNEVTNGMLWPEGRISGAGGYDGFTALLKQGIRAVRDQDPNPGSATARIKVMIHLDSGGNNGLYRTFFAQMRDRAVDYDVIGFSFYPYWHGTLSQLQGNLNDISQSFGKEVAVAETAYGYTLDNGDSEANIFGASQQATSGYPATVQGQATFVRDVIAAVSNVPQARGLGIFYWEPDWFPVAGAGWRTGNGNGWENQALFDFQGQALPSLRVFNLVGP